MKARTRPGKAQLQRVAVQCAHALDLAVVVETAALQGRVAQIDHAEQLGVFQQVQARALVVAGRRSA